MALDIICGANLQCRCCKLHKRGSHHVDHNYLKYHAFVSLRVGILVSSDFACQQITFAVYPLLAIIQK